MKFKLWINEGFTFDKLKKDKKSWYNDPQMAGHHWAKNTVDDIEIQLEKIIKTKIQKDFANVMFDYSSTDWHYFNQTSKKERRLTFYILRRVGKKPYLELLYWLNKNEGMMKSHLTHILEYLSYKFNHDDYLKYYAPGFMSLGMDKKNTIDKYKKYHKDLLKYSYVKEINRKIK